MTPPADLVASWWTYAAAGLREGTIAFAILLALWWPLRRRLPAGFVCLLFLLPLLKIAIPFDWPAPSWWSPRAWLGLSASAPALTATPLTIEQVEALLATLPTDAEAAPAFASTAPTPFGMQQLLCALWLAGVCFLTLRFARAQVRTHRAVGAATPLDPRAVPLDLHALRARAGVFRRVRWLVSDAVATPAAGGILHPYILLPRGFVERMPAPQLTFVLLHELAHVRRADVAVATAQRLVQIVWFFHPAVWFANWFIDQHRELACDYDALRRSRASRRECGEAFLSVAAWLHGRVRAPTATLAMFETQRVLRRRLMQILNDVPAPSRLLTAAYLAVATALTLPAAKADAGVSCDATLLAQQQGDDDQRAEIAKLRKQLAELREQLAKLQSDAGAKKEPKSETKTLRLAKVDRADKKDRADDEDDKDHEEVKARVVEVKTDGGKAFTFKAGGKRAKAFIVEDGEMREIDADDIKPIWTRALEGGDHVFRWSRARDDDDHDDDDGDDKEGARRVRVFRAGDGDHDVEVDAPQWRGRVMRHLDKLPHAWTFGGGKWRAHEAGDGVFVLRGDGGGAFTFRTEDDDDGDAPKVKVIRTKKADNDDDRDGAEPKTKSPRGSAGKGKAERLDDVTPRVIEVRVDGEGLPKALVRKVKPKAVIDV
jgi:beta-lactamase regulating signal transducer with metallopeptidase domain